MTADEFELRHLAKNLANAYATLDELKWTPVRQEQVRKMKPTFNSQSPEPDGDWALNLQIELMRDTPDDTIPGGLRSMACDALNHTSARGYGDELRPGVLCAYLYRHAWEISEKFPAVDDLAELLRGQADYINRQISKRHPPARESGRGEARHNSTVICRLLAQDGIDMSPELLRKWAERGKITSIAESGRNLYRISEVLPLAVVLSGTSQN
ncbi:hypothetical protein [Corynebacterium sanguinis]|uniref:Uncharacterized protein n=1 Tax=Corynebacterium sanguinis TaxID=2594913 RepID=A0A6C1U440_9CORY|nr:hypothetical protein [Corynebacterium sanguinis]TVS29811.1 hypothetical protein EKI59_02510 [Corynebacterium sanguinis]